MSSGDDITMTASPLRGTSDAERQDTRGGASFDNDIVHVDLAGDEQEQATDGHAVATRRTSLRLSDLTVSGSAALLADVPVQEHGPSARCRVQNKFLTTRMTACSSAPTLIFFKALHN